MLLFIAYASLNERVCRNTQVLNRQQIDYMERIAGSFGTYEETWDAWMYVPVFMY